MAGRLEPKAPLPLAVCTHGAGGSDSDLGIMPDEMSSGDLEETDDKQGGSGQKARQGDPQQSEEDSDLMGSADGSGE